MYDDDDDDGSASARSYWRRGSSCVVVSPPPLFFSFCLPYAFVVLFSFSLLRFAPSIHPSFWAILMRPCFAYFRAGVLAFFF